MATKIQWRRGTAAAWTAANPVLAAGEPGLETDTKKRKVGDGTTAWSSLAYDTQSTPAAFQVPPGFVGLTHPMVPNNVTVAFATALRPGGIRVRMTKTGILSDITICQSTAAGNWLAGVYSTAATRALLSSLAPVAAAGTWLSLGNPGIAVTEGDWLDFVVANDTTTATLKAFGNNGPSGTLPTSLWPNTPGGAAPKLAFTYPTQATLVMPATVAEGVVTPSALVPGIFGLIT